MLPEVLGAPQDLPLEPVEHMSFAICSIIPSGVRCASARRLISEFMARWTLENTKLRRWIACSAHVLRARGPQQSCAVLVAVLHRVGERRAERRYLIHLWIKFRRWNACSARVLRARGPQQRRALLVAVDVVRCCLVLFGVVDVVRCCLVLQGVVWCLLMIYQEMSL